MVAGLSFLSKKLGDGQNVKILILGAGAGIMSKFFYYNLPNVTVEAVEISNNVIEVYIDKFSEVLIVFQVGKKYFEWPIDDRHKIIQGDALTFVKELASKQKAAQPEEPKTEEKKEETVAADQDEETKNNQENAKTSQGVYDVIIVDINDSSSGSKLSPPKEFLEQEYLENLKSLLNESGILMINLIPAETSVLDECLKDINKTFDVIYVAKPETEVNYVAYMRKENLRREKNHDGSELIIVDEGMVPSKKELENVFKNIVKSAKWDATMNLASYCGEINVKYPRLNASAFTMTNVQVANKGGEYTNKTKEMYLEDKEKVEKNQRKKKKNKKR